MERGVSQGCQDLQGHRGTRGLWVSQEAMELLEKMEWQVCQGTMGSQGKRVRQGLLVRGVLQEKEVGQGPLVEEHIVPRMHSP